MPVRRRLCSLLLAGACLILAAPAWTQMLESEPLEIPSVPSPEPPAADPGPFPTAAAPAPEPAPLAARKLYPYYYSAYIMPVDKTEIDMGLILSGTPGIAVSLGWGAMDKLMVAALMAVEGASYTSGFRLTYNLREESEAETKPALSVLADWRYLNRRTGGDVKENIFRGNRIALGGSLSKDFGSLGRALGASRSSLEWLTMLSLHTELFAELQTGRERADEIGVTRVEIGVRGGLEAAIDPSMVVFVTYDSLPNLLTRDNYYAGLRYYTRSDFVLEGRVGRIGNDVGLAVAIAWVL